MPMVRACRRCWLGYTLAVGHLWRAGTGRHRRRHPLLGGNLSRAEVDALLASNTSVRFPMPTARQRLSAVVLAQHADAAPMLEGMLAVQQARDTRMAQAPDRSPCTRAAGGRPLACTARHRRAGLPAIGGTGTGDRACVTRRRRRCGRRRSAVGAGR